MNTSHTVPQRVPHTILHSSSVSSHSYSLSSPPTTVPHVSLHRAHRVPHNSSYSLHLFPYSSSQFLTALHRIHLVPPIVFISDPLIVPHTAPHKISSSHSSTKSIYSSSQFSFSPSSTQFLIVHTIPHSSQQTTQCHVQFHTHTCHMDPTQFSIHFYTQSLKVSYTSPHKSLT